jgi:perosamine synthetase
MHEQPVFQRMGLFKNERYPIAERLARQGLYLPSGIPITTEQIEHVCNVLQEALKQA